MKGEHEITTFKYGDIIALKSDVKPVMSLDAETFFSVPDNEDAKVKTYWGLTEDAFEIDDIGNVYLKAEYAKRFRWGVDYYDKDTGLLNINVSYDPIGDVNPGAFCSWVDRDDIEQ